MNDFDMPPVPDSLPETPRGRYRYRANRFERERARLAGISGRLSHLRTGAFVALVVAGLFVERRAGFISITAAVLVLVAFIALVVAHQRVRRRERWHEELIGLNEQGIHRLDRDWDRLPKHTPNRDVAAHAYAADLDLFGRASLTQILGPVGSAYGISTLDAWLLERASPQVIPARQQAVRELASRNDLRDAMAIHGRRTREVRLRDVERFLRWAEGGTWLRERPWLRVLAWVLPVVTWVLLVLHIAGAVGAALWMIPMLATLAFYFTIGMSARRVLDEAFGREGVLAQYPELLKLVTEPDFAAPLLREIESRLDREGEPAHRQLHRLRRLMHLADLRLSSLHVPVYLLSMWDIHVLGALERWQVKSGAAVRDWLSALGELEALASLATLAHDQPEWAFAEFATDGAAVFEAESLGHPLLSDEARVSNDVSVGPPGTFLLVTGSNMSGKSTLLRALGTNTVLAQAGAPSCALRLRLPPLEVHTSIRVQDSLARGVSYFMAELERLKQIVDAAQMTQQAGDATQLFLLDEILHGTNTAERRIAARRVIRHLVDTGAIGAVTTHDLELAEEPVLAPHAELVHFQERFDDGDDGTTLNFDYRLRRGLATSTNALKLMRLVGLPGDS
jgi:hypothetical protein